MVNSLKEWLKSKLRRGLSIPDLEQKIEDLQQESEAIKSYGIAPWYEENLWEPSVQIALKDLCGYGDTVFDVGANFGGLSSAMSRYVGPKGVVCAFEASPRIIDKCQRNLMWNGCFNVQLYHAAIYHESNNYVPLYLGGHLNDSIYPEYTQGKSGYSVPTLSLDDFVEQTNLVPNLIKMDIEGAEADALKGMIGLIRSAQPHLILETQASEPYCLEFLRKEGYIAIDLNRYKVINSIADYPPKTAIRNNLYIHQDRLSQTPYQTSFDIVEVSQLQAEEFAKAGSAKITLKKPLELTQGRYIIDVKFNAEGTDNNLICGIKTEDEIILRYHGYSHLIAENYRDWVIHLSKSTAITLYFEFLQNTGDPTLSIEGATIYKVTNFDTVQWYFK